MDVGQIGKESGVIDQFFQELPEKASEDLISAMIWYGL